MRLHTSFPLNFSVQNVFLLVGYSTSHKLPNFFLCTFTTLCAWPFLPGWQSLDWKRCIYVQGLETKQINTLFPYWSDGSASILQTFTSVMLLRDSWLPQQNQSTERTEESWLMRFMYINHDTNVGGGLNSALKHFLTRLKKELNQIRTALPRQA